MESSDLRDMNLEPSSKRRKLIQHADDDSTKFVVNPGPMPTSVKETSPSEVNVQISGTTCRSKKKSSISTSTKRASALNLHNYPSDHHPIGIAIWLLQKIDQARRSRSRSASSSSSGSESKTFAKPVPPLQPLKPAPQFQSGWNSTAAADPTQANALIDPSQAHPSLVGAGTYHPVYAHLDGGHQEEDNGRLQSQRNRKSKQRSENWAKSTFPRRCTVIPSNLYGFQIKRTTLLHVQNWKQRRNTVQTRRLILLLKQRNRSILGNGPKTIMTACSAGMPSPFVMIWSG